MFDIAARTIEKALSDKSNRACEGQWSDAFRLQADATRQGRRARRLVEPPVRCWHEPDVLGSRYDVSF